MTTRFAPGTLLRTRLALVAIAWLTLTAAACGGSGGDSGAVAPVIQVALSKDGCTPATITAVAGETRFLVQNPTSSSVNRFELRSGEKVLLSLTNVLGGISRGGTVTLEPGTYVMLCAGGGVDGRGEIRVAE